MAAEYNRFRSRFGLRMALTFFAGMLVPVVLYFVAGLVGLIPAIASARLVKKWNITEDFDPNVNTLLVNSRVNPGERICTGIDRYATGVYRVTVTVDRDTGNDKLTETFLMFAYVSKGPSGKPEAYYGRMSSDVWRDRDADGVIDQELNFADNVVRINLGREWLDGLGKEVVRTSRGSFRFNAAHGQWEAVDPNTLKVK
jgi:hypothetical protein